MSWNNIRSRVSNTSRKSPIFLLQKESKPVYGVFVGEPHAVEYTHKGRNSLKVFINFYMTETSEMRVLACCPEMFKEIDRAIQENGQDGNVFGVQKVLSEMRGKPWINFEVFLHERVDPLHEYKPFDLTTVAESWSTQNAK